MREVDKEIQKAFATARFCYVDTQWSWCHQDERREESVGEYCSQSLKHTPFAIRIGSLQFRKATSMNPGTKSLMRTRWLLVMGWVRGGARVDLTAPEGLINCAVLVCSILFICAFLIRLFSKLNKYKFNHGWSINMGVACCNGRSWRREIFQGTDEQRNAVMEQLQAMEVHSVSECWQGIAVYNSTVALWTKLNFGFTSSSFDHL